jgi:prepilin-type N-terminal cleavage/methylation domain-containing protein
VLFKSEKGFSLIETLIGLVIFGLIEIAILSSLAASSRANVTNANLTRAESLARSQMEFVKSQTYINDPNPVYQTIATPLGYSFVTPMAARVGDSGNDIYLQKIIVSVQHDNHTLFTITDYKVNR